MRTVHTTTIEIPTLVIFYWFERGNASPPTLASHLEAACKYPPARKRLGKFLIVKKDNDKILRSEMDWSKMRLDLKRP